MTKAALHKAFERTFIVAWLSIVLAFGVAVPVAYIGWANRDDPAFLLKPASWAAVGLFLIFVCVGWLLAWQGMRQLGSTTSRRSTSFLVVVIASITFVAGLLAQEYAVMVLFIFPFALAPLIVVGTIGFIFVDMLWNPRR